MVRNGSVEAAAAGDVLQRLADESAIRNVVLRYARAIDRMDEDLLRSCYHSDAIDDHGPYKGSVGGFIDWVMPVLAGFESTTHFIGNHLVEIEGDVAWAESYCIALHRTWPTENEPASDIVGNARYVDRLERRDGEWRIAHRVVVRDPGRKDVVTQEFPVGRESQGTPTGIPEFPLERPGTDGRRDSSDASYDRSRRY
jgi:hypothetical protein